MKFLLNKLFLNLAYLPKLKQMTRRYKNLLLSIKKSDQLDQKTFLHDLVNIHYVRNDLVLEPGTFRVRGDVIEIFPAYEEFLSNQRYNRLFPFQIKSFIYKYWFRKISN